MDYTCNMDYTLPLRYHYRPKKGWINDPNGLVYFDGYYHVFYQHAPHFEVPWKEAMYWGHARTKDFLSWEELPPALVPDMPYDRDGCWSGTAIEKDGKLYLFYASTYKKDKDTRRAETVSVAYSSDGIHFEKYGGNPVIRTYPKEGGPDFRDPAVAYIDGKYYCVMATGNPDDKAARLLLYGSDDLFTWEYKGVMSEWANCKYAECPSFMEAEGGRYLLTASVCPLESRHYFSLMYGSFRDGKFTLEDVGDVDKGPDQYAGQVFRDHRGRNILISWIPGWKYKGWAEKDVGCMSIPREIFCRDGKVYGYPVEEVRHLLTDSDPAVERTEEGFVIARTGRDPVVYRGEVRELKILRDGYILEVFVNGGEAIYSVLL